ncbi:MAG: pantoate--beta-alanine ligase [Verrucomicrobiota bacterium]|jgi:pantoate--beta-alanine ligase|nr:pantoate--beta-alanine ligase [Verrucomicrobiota bacterium]HCF95965.1 pantoate--beta-alanine ligase [Verrucomicrobiota bacterium]
MAQLIRLPQEMNSVSKGFHAKGRTIALVPTMGALHLGHRMLMRQARTLADELVVSIFVNPLQFAPNEDFERYPSDLEADLAICEAEEVDVVFAPTAPDIYLPDASCVVVEERLSQVLEGEARPTHFRGVTTVVAKLFNLVEPDVAVFGQKDYQQLCVIRRMIRDLNYSIELVMGPTVRESDGLAMSSRNRYLSSEERKQALGLRKALLWVEGEVAAGRLEVEALERGVRELLQGYALIQLDYLAIVDRVTLVPLQRVEPESTAVAIAAFLGRTRLIDNILL